MFVTLIFFLIIAGLIGGLIYVMGSPNRYTKMTEDEFEEETKKGPGLGGAIIGMERALRTHEADLVIEQKYRVEKDATAPGGEPPEEPQPPGGKGPKN